jgi:hypothetical protein
VVTPDDDGLITERGHGVNVTLHVNWTFTLDKRDSLLMLKALGGRLKGPEVELAKSLGDRLTVLRSKCADDVAESLRRHAANATKQENPDDDRP